ncbi:formylglycine-generating enzyme family protein [Verrucomicrobiales bacterium]|nr:formylglycine-generating enzyme family protein [Verrucomicrobiales bacterium]
MVWYNDNCGGKTHEVGVKKANAWGLHDVHGNVREWCSDWFAASLAGGKDPSGPITGSKLVHRGGHWYHGARHARAAHRMGIGSTSSYDSLGLRVMCLRSPGDQAGE